MTQRHHALRDAFHTACVQMSIQAAKEVTARGGKRPADVLLQNWDRGADMAVDFNVAHPLALSEFPLCLDSVARHSAREEATKMAESDEVCARMRWGFMPAGMSTFGGTGPSFQELLKEVLARGTGDLRGWPKTERVLEVHRGLSLAVARHVARQLAVRNRVRERAAEARL